MKKTQAARGSQSGQAYSALTDKAVYGDQALTHGIDRKEKTFESDSAEQGWSLRSNEAWSRDFIAVQSQPCLGDRPNISLPASDHDPLRPGRLQLKLFRQRTRHHSKGSSGVHKELNFFGTARGTGQASLYVKQFHSRYLLKRTDSNSESEQCNRSEQAQEKSEKEKFHWPAPKSP
jgi:hypothetical protein